MDYEVGSRGLAVHERTSGTCQLAVAAPCTARQFPYNFRTPSARAHSRHRHSTEPHWPHTTPARLDRRLLAQRGGGIKPRRRVDYGECGAEKAAKARRRP